MNLPSITGQILFVFGNQDTPGAHSPYNRIIVKLLVCIIHSRDRNRVSDELVRAGFKFTSLDSTGGYLRESNKTLILGVEEDQVNDALAILELNCPAREQVVSFMPMEASPAGAMITSPVKVQVGGAVVFVLTVEQFVRF